MNESKQVLDSHEKLIYREILRLRSLHRILENKDFVDLVVNSDSEQQTYVYICILCRDVKKLRDWMKNQPKEIEDLSFRDLRDLARKFQIRNYSRKSKYQIAREIKNKDIKNKDIKNKGMENGEKFVSGNLD